MLECAWDELIQQVEKAKDLDHVIAAHQVFLDTVLTRSLLDTQSVVSILSSVVIKVLCAVRNQL